MTLAKLFRVPYDLEAATDMDSNDRNVFIDQMAEELGVDL